MHLSELFSFAEPLLSAPAVGGRRQSFYGDV